MDFALSDEQVLLDGTVRRFLEENLPISRVREVIAEDAALDERAWSGLAELGIAGCLVPESHGGADLRLLDAALVAAALGHGAAPLPFLGSAVLAPLLVRAVASPAVRDEWLPKLADGRVRMTMAAAERCERRADAGVRDEDGRLTGVSLFVPDGAGAAAFWVPVGDDVCLVAADAPGLDVRPMTTIDATRGLVELGYERVAPIERFRGVGDAMDRVIDAARVALAADILGCCDRALSMSVAYAMDREQFGRPIATFQAVKHLCAEMAAALEPARSLLWYAAHSFDAMPDEAALNATLCKAHLSDVGHDLVRTATEVHGGIGFTDEYDLQLWFKRVGLSRQWLGGPARTREHAARLQGLV